MITFEEMLEYKDRCGEKAAADLLLLAGPGGFDGSYELYEALMEEWGDER